MESEPVYEQGRPVELIDYLDVIWKWKYFIIGITLLFIVGALIFSLVMKKVYKVSVVIEPGVMDILAGGKLLYLDSPENLASKIQNKAFNQDIIRDLDLDPKKNHFNFYVTSPPKSSALHVYIESSDTFKGKRILHSLIQALKRHYGEISSKRENQVITGINVRRDYLEYYLGRVEEIRKEIEKAQKDSKQVMKEGEKIVNNQKNINTSHFLLYSSTLQQHISYITGLEHELSDALKGVRDLQKEIEDLEVKKGLMKDLNVVQKPQSSILPIRPKKVIFIVVGAVAGFFLSLFSIFFIEYIRKAGGRKREL